MVVLPAALVAAGCGGGGGSDSSATSILTDTGTTALTKADFIDQGDAICAEVNAAAGALSSDTSTTSTASDTVSQEADLYSGMVDRLNSLGAPDGDSDAQGVLSAASKLSDAEDEAKLAAGRNDTAALASAQSTVDAAKSDFESTASDYGFKDCGKGPTASVTTGSTASGTAAGTSTTVTPLSRMSEMRPQTSRRAAG